MVGPRAMGMGGAGVAVTTDALATYWNPAGLAMTQTVDIRFVGGGQAIDRLGIADAINDLENFNTNDTSPANMPRHRTSPIASIGQEPIPRSTARPDSISRVISASTRLASIFPTCRPAVDSSALR